MTFPVYAGLYMPALEKPEEFERALRGVHKRGGVSDANWAVFERLLAE